MKLSSWDTKSVIIMKI
ncbi:MAG: hypothetical protein GX102_15050 [Porphyromonadaceae bacterium]|nr:hypothetical protein [Porphyromonadaceae bacterium]